MSSRGSFNSASTSIVVAYQKISEALKRLQQQVGAQAGAHMHQFAGALAKPKSINPERETQTPKRRPRA